MSIPATSSDRAAPAVLQRITAEPSIRAVLEQLSSGDARVSLYGLLGSSPAMVTALLAQRLNRPLLVVVANQVRLYDFEEDLRFFRSWLSLRENADDVFPFPHIETLPYEDRDPQIDIRLQRERVRQLLAGAAVGAPARPVVLAPVRSVMRRLPPRKLALARTRVIERGNPVDRQELCRELVEEGYEYREIVSGPGQFSLRGGIVDVFPVPAPAPYRIELWGDDVDSIRVFDLESQRSTGHVEACSIFPGREHRLAVRHAAEGGALESLIDALPPDTLIVVDDLDAVAREAEKVEALVRRMHEERRLKEKEGAGSEDADAEEADEAPLPLVRPDAIWDAAIPLVNRLLRDAHLVCEARAEPSGQAESPRHAVVAECLSAEVIGDKVEDRLTTPLTQAARGEHVTVVCDNNGQVERLHELLRSLEAKVPDWSGAAAAVESVVGSLHNGFALPAAGLRLYTDRELFHRYKRFRTTRFSLGEPVYDIVDLKPGDFVVHVDHGIARYRGLAMMDADGGGRKEFLELRFAEDAVLYVPLEQMERVGRYVGTGDDAPTLSRLGTKAWSRTKARAREAIEEMAEELLELYANRQLANGHAYSDDTVWQHEFEASFVFTETEDQLRSIAEVKQDMESEQPMDRLLCGDVGFGKTEVAIRAAFKAAMDGMQVAVLVPTTVLAEQHYRTFRERLADYPVRVEMLSRFRTDAEVRAVVEQLKQGEIDIVICTHKVLGKAIGFRNLGLVVIDEEQRFGVRHKERLKQMRTQVDVLTLTATPIPRTLYLSMSGIRDMSLVNTPPRDRLPIETYVLNWNRQTVEAAILREMSRGGQVYFVHNEVKTIESVAAMIGDIVPEARVCVGHGQMSDRELEFVMRHFVDGDYDVLVSTTIIESGIDIPNVNTIVINRADHFGLAQLYQLRGRVGRSHHQAYCYLFVRDLHSVTDDARRRLVAIQEFNQLGSGFQVALRDLEIRGMGNILGRQQSGYIASIGFELYNQMLRDTVARLRSRVRAMREEGPVLEEMANIQVDLGAPALVPPSYVPSGKQRMALHKRFARLASDRDVEAMREEVEDLYGRMPDEVARLFDTLRVKVLARQAGIARVAVDKDGVFLQFGDYRTRQFDPTDVLELERLLPGHVRLRQTRKAIGISLPLPETFERRVALVSDALKALRLRIAKEISAERESQ